MTIRVSSDDDEMEIVDDGAGLPPIGTSDNIFITYSL